jgi:tetratricopeptide (TPR) repeat protein
LACDIQIFGENATKLRISVCAALFLTGMVEAAAAEKPWLEVRSPHFRVLTDASANDARKVAYEFEQMRAVFAGLFPNFRLESGAPLVIFAARDEDTAKSLAPFLWKMKGAKPAGYFQQSWEKKYALVRLDTWGTGAHQVVFHEYTHSILHINAHWLPTWMDEGMAEFYAYTRFEGNKTFVGAPTDRFRSLQTRTLIPIETLIAVNQRSPYYHDEDKVQLFYAESWALIHFMTFGPGMEGAKKLNVFFAKLQQREEQKKAFVEVFGSFAEMDKALDLYVHKFQLTAGVMKTLATEGEKAYPARTLSMAETQAEIGGYHLWTHDHANALNYVDDALRNDPKLGLAHEEKGFLDFSDGKDEESVNEFTQAIAADGTLYLSLFAQTMLAPMATSDAPADQEAFKKALNAVIAVNPQYAPAYVQLARLAVRQKDLNVALGYSRKAEELEPFRAGYHLQSGQILLRMERGADAAKFAKFVADHWFGPDHDEAWELWDQVPEALRPASEPITETPPADTQRVEGRLKSLECGKEDSGALNLEHAGQTLTFHRKGGYLVGFSDSLWYGEDHFSVCHHLAGLRTIVYFRPGANATYAGDIAEIEIRDDLPAPAAAIKAVAAPGTTNQPEKPVPHQFMQN